LPLSARGAKSYSAALLEAAAQGWNRAAARIAKPTAALYFPPEFF
jgi:hypothetical protein